jgi:NOL1/NOP2/fmu family ribosome biogenesis protein
LCWPSALKPGGFLVYSTCTFNEKENEENVGWMMNEYGFKSIPVDINKSWPIVQSVNNPDIHAYRFLPHLVKGEGLFLACLQKSDNEVTPTNKFREQPLAFVHRKNTEEIKKWLTNADEYDFIEWNKNIHAILKNQIADLTVLAKYLHLKNAGIMMGELLKEKLLPDHHLALSSALSPSINRIDVTKEEAQKYLKKDTLILTQKYEQGIYLITYEGLGLGWVKVLQNRINNYLPTHFRILKDIK